MLHTSSRSYGQSAVRRQRRPERLYIRTVSEVHRRQPVRRRYCPDAVDTWMPCTALRSACAISRAMAMPFGRRRVRAVGAAHPLHAAPPARGRPGTSLAMNSAFRTLSNGKMPGDDRQPRALDALQERARSSRRRKSAASARTRRRPRPCSRTAAAPRRGSTPPGSPTRRCESRSARRSPGRRRRSRG